MNPFSKQRARRATIDIHQRPGRRVGEWQGMGLALAGLAVSLLASSCNSTGPAARADVEQVTSALVSSASLQLKVLTNSCGANQMQDFFQVINTGTAAVKLSDIKIKYWADDTSGQFLVPRISTGGCASGSNGSPSCLHQVTGVTATASSFSPACGPDSTHQANWEITVSATDSTTLAAGATWNGIQTAVNLANYSNFNPGTGKWFSPCLSGSSYVADPHFALYYQGNLVFANGISAPACRSQGLQPVTGHLTPDILATPIIGPMPQTTVLHLGIGLPLSNPAAADAQIAQVTDPSSPLYRHYLSVDDFTAAYGPSTSNHNNVVAWAQSKGLTVEHTYPNRRQVNVSGTVAAIEKALNVNIIFRRRPDGTTFWAPDREPSLDLAPTTVVSYINQLQNFFVPKRASGSAVDGASRALTFAGPTSPASIRPRTVRGNRSACSGATGSRSLQSPVTRPQPGSTRRRSGPSIQIPTSWPASHSIIIAGTARFAPEPAPPNTRVPARCSVQTTPHAWRAAPATMTTQSAASVRRRAGARRAGLLVPAPSPAWTPAAASRCTSTSRWPCRWLQV